MSEFAHLTRGELIELILEQRKKIKQYQENNAERLSFTTRAIEKMKRRDSEKAGRILAKNKKQKQLGDE